MTDTPTITPSDREAAREFMEAAQPETALNNLTQLLARHAQQAREEEREACAKEADDNAHEECEVAEAIAAAIRNRTLKDQAE